MIFNIQYFVYQSKSHSESAYGYALYFSTKYPIFSHKT